MAGIQPTFLIKGFFLKETLDLSFFLGQFCLLMLGSADIFFHSFGGFSNLGFRCNI